jgi:hypothetical protein
MRRIGLLTLAAAAAAAAISPSPAPAANKCVSDPSVPNCVQTLKDVGPSQTDALLYYAENPDEIIVCVRECGGEPPR